MATKQRLGDGISGEFAQKNSQVPSSGPDIVNKTYADSLLASTISLPEALLLKSFFSHNGFLTPAFTTFKEEVYDYPAPGYQNLNGGSLTRSMSQALFVSGGSNSANIGWDLGAAKSTILAIMTGKTQITGLGIALSDSLPSTGPLPSGSYLIAVYHTLVGIYKVTAGPTVTLLGSVNTIVNGSSYSSPTFSFAFYYDDTTNRLIVFLRVGPEQWFPVVDLTDSTFTTMRYVSATFENTGVITQRGLCPLGIYHS